MQRQRALPPEGTREREKRWERVRKTRREGPLRIDRAADACAHAPRCVRARALHMSPR